MDSFPELLRIARSLKIDSAPSAGDPEAAADLVAAAAAAADPAAVVPPTLENFVLHNFQ